MVSLVRSIMFLGNLLIRVIHVIGDRVKTGLAWARVTANGASRALASLSRSVRHQVTATGATALESVVQAKPVTNFMGGSLAEVES